MPVRSPAQWQLVLDGVSIWSACDYLMQDLLNFSWKSGVENLTLNADRQQLENFLVAWEVLAQTKARQRANNGGRSVAIVDPSQTSSVEEWRRLFTKMTVKEASETVISGVLYDPSSDYWFCVQTLAKVMTAWAANAVHTNGGSEGARR